MKVKIKFLFILLFVSLLIGLYFMGNGEHLEHEIEESVTNGSQQEKIDENIIKDKVSEKITKAKESEIEPKILHYKDVFKEPVDLESSVDAIVENESLQQLDKESNKLILEADSFIKEHNLTLSLEKNINSKEEVNLENIKKLEKNIDNILTN